MVHDGSRRGGVGRRSRLRAVTLLLAGALASHVQAQPPPVSPDDFAAAAAGSDQYEISAAKVALVETRNREIRRFAQEMIRDHMSAFQDLQQACARSGLEPPAPIVGPEQARLLSALQSARGADFDRTYVRQQRLAHEQALTTERGYAHDGSDPNLRALADKDTPMIERHRQAAQKLPSLAAS